MKWMKRLGSLVLAGCVAASVLPAMAVDAYDADVDKDGFTLETHGLYFSPGSQAADGYVCIQENLYPGSGYNWETDYEFNAAGQPVKSVANYGYGVTEYTYDANGRLTKEYYADWGTWVEYKYDSNGNCIREYRYNGTETEACEEEYYDNTYGSDGKLSSTKYQGRYNGSVESSATITYTCNSSGQLTQEIYKSDGETVYKLTYSYNSDGKLFQIKVTGKPHFEIEERETYQYSYNSNGTVSKISITTADENSNFKRSSQYSYEFSYDADGNRTEVKSVSSTGGVSERYTYKYAPISRVQQVAGAFSDLEIDSWYTDAVLWAVDNGITVGTSSTTFSPNDGCTRAQIVTFLWRSAGSPEPTTTSSPFTDVSADDWYAKAVLWAVENGITQGTSAVTFSPNETCTRSQAVTFIWRANGNQAAGSSNPFSDVASGQWYTNAVLWAVANNITVGTSATTFAPNNTCTRGQIVTFLYRAAV